jgi:hypothetical protein
MKALFVASLLSATALVAGCASQKPALVLDPVGPPAMSPTPGTARGWLVVFSALDPHAHFSSLPYDVFYTDYTILSQDGKLLQKVPNNPNSSLPGPTKVELAAGTYRVMARANGYGTVTVPVVVAAHQTTTLHLEGAGGWRNRAALAQTNPVRLPDGRIVGWRAEVTDLSQTR